MPAACDLSNSYPYLVKHDPFVFYKDIEGNSTRCQTHVLPLTSWNTSVASGTVPNYSFIAPNMYDDGHDTSVAFASTWLQKFLTPLVNKTSFASTTYIITFDEGTSSHGAGGTDAGPTNSTGGGHVYLAFVSPLSQGIGNLGGPTNGSSHYSALATIEWLLNIGSTGHKDSSIAWPPIKAAFG